MTTITRLKQLRDWLKGSQQTERVQRTRITPDNTLVTAASLVEAVEAWKGNAPNHTTMITLPKTPSWMATIDRFASYGEKMIPNLQAAGYGYFLSCDSNDYIEHQKWCDEHCNDTSLPHCDVWQISTVYPRAFASKEDAAVFKLTFNATNILGDE